MVSASCLETPSGCSWCRSRCCPSSGNRPRRTPRCLRSCDRWGRPPSPRSPTVQYSTVQSTIPSITRRVSSVLPMSVSRVNTACSGREPFVMVPGLCQQLTGSVSELLFIHCWLLVTRLVAGCVLRVTNLGVSRLSRALWNVSPTKRLGRWETSIVSKL